MLRLLKISHYDFIISKMIRNFKQKRRVLKLFVRIWNLINGIDNGLDLYTFNHLKSLASMLLNFAFIYFSQYKYKNTKR